MADDDRNSRHPLERITFSYGGPHIKWICPLSMIERPLLHSQTLARYRVILSVPKNPAANSTGLSVAKLSFMLRALTPRLDPLPKRRRVTVIWKARMGSGDNNAGTSDRRTVPALCVGDKGSISI